MTFEEKLKEKAKVQAEYVMASELPSEIEAKIQGEPIFKADKKGNECLYMTMLLKDGKTTVQKITPTAYSYLEQTTKQCGGLSELQNTWHKWTKKRIGKAYDRFFPEPTPKKIK